MIKGIDELKKERPDLVEEFEKMDKDQLLRQCYLECIDAINMEERVSIFMAECTDNMSKTNYTKDSIISLIEKNKEKEIDFFCEDLVEFHTDDEILELIKERGNE